jgi:hypothetical protein
MQVQSFMKTHVKPKIEAFLVRPCSSTSEIFLKKILFYLQEAKMEFTLEKVKREDLFFSETDTFPRNPNYHSIPKEIRGIIDPSLKIGKKAEFEIKGRKYTIYFIVPLYDKVHEKEAKKLKVLFDREIHRIWEWFYVASFFTSGIHCSPILNIYLYWTDHKKVLPNTFKEELIYQELKETNINTGFTLACPQTKNEICIFRWEEWYKVLIHESFHSLGFDFVHLDETPVQKAMYQIFPVKTTVQLYEAYNEFWAEFLQILFICYKPIYREDSKTELPGAFTTVLKKVQEKLEIEILFSQFQASKVLYYYGLSYRDLYLPSSAEIRRKKYREQSGAFSYYILKNIFLSYYPEFIDLCIHLNKGSLQCKKTQSVVLHLVDFIKEHYSNPAFISRMDSLFRFIRENNKDKRAVETIQTLRFTLTE